MTIRYFDSDEEMLTYLAEQAEEGARLAEDHPVKVEHLDHGDCFISVRTDFECVIFGEVQTRDDKYPEDTPTIQDGRKKGFVYGYCYSTLCPEGEIGSTHITRVNAKISRAVFERAKANGWRHLKASN